MTPTQRDIQYWPQTSLYVCLFTDLVGSTAWKRLLLDQNYAKELLIPHDALFRQLLSEFPEAAERVNTGDGFLATFKSPSMATLFALRFHDALASFDWSPDIRRQGIPTTRIGIHLGEIVEFKDVTGIKLSGQAVDLAARVMSLGEGGSTLLTRHAFDSSRQHIMTNPVDESVPLVWMSHGLYRFKGNDDDPLEIFGIAPAGSPTLVAPSDSEKAFRVNTHDDTGSWRPAAGQPIPRRDNWLLHSQIGEGGFGEVWLGENKLTREFRVFKFCFDSNRLRSFKRELALFKLLQQKFGDQPNFVRLIDVQFDEAPFCIESEYVQAGNLTQWVSQHSFENWPLDDRLRFLAELADAVASAHSVNVVHKDLKPSNILIRLTGENPKPVVADFGIGVLTDTSVLLQNNITFTGGINTLFSNDSSRTGTRLYAPPESLQGVPASTASDVYALGVLLYQMVLGDLNRPLGTGWEDSLPSIKDSIRQMLIADIRNATRSEPALRTDSAATFANQLRQLNSRVKSATRRKVLVKLAQVLAAAYMTSAIVMCFGILIIMNGPITSINEHLTNLADGFVVVLLMVCSAALALVIVNQDHPELSWRNISASTLRNSLILSSLVLGPVSLMTYWRWHRPTRSIRAADMAIFVFGLMGWLYNAYMISCQLYSMQSCRSAQKFLDAGDLSNAKELATRSVNCWTRNYVARNVLAQTLVHQQQNKEAIEVLSAILSSFDLESAAEPARAAAWLADRFDDRSVQYELIGMSEEAAGDRFNAKRVRSLKFNSLGYQE